MFIQKALVTPVFSVMFGMFFKALFPFARQEVPLQEVTKVLAQI